MSFTYWLSRMRLSVSMICLSVAWITAHFAINIKRIRPWPPLLIIRTMVTGEVIMTRLQNVFKNMAL